MGDLNVMGSVSLPKGQVSLDLDGQTCVANKKGLKVDSYTCGDASFDVANRNLSFTLEPGSRLTIYDSNEQIYTIFINMAEPVVPESTTPSTPTTETSPAYEYGRYGCP